MDILKKLLQIALEVFFKIFFSLFGKPKFSKNLQQAVDLYSKSQGFEKLFASIRAWDAPYDRLDKYIPQSGTIIDLGCGDGLLANFLAISSKKRKIVGLEVNKARVLEADRGFSRTVFKHADVLKYSLPKANTYVIAHVLHHLPSKTDQEILIRKVYKKLNTNGTFVILEIDNKPLLKYLFTWLTDAITVPVLFEGKLFTTKFFYRKRLEWENLLKQSGFKVKTKALHQNTPFSHILFVATK